MQIFPQSDDFVENATPYGELHAGHCRLVPWASDAGSGDSIVAAVGNLSSAYFTSPSGAAYQNFGAVPKRASVFNASGTASAVSCFAWTPFYAGRATSKLAFTWLHVSGATTLTDFRYAMVGTRIAGQSISNTAGSEALIDGDGYWLVFRNATSQPGAKFMLLRVNGGVTTKLAESALVNISSLLFPQGMWISIVAVTSGSTVILQCKRGAIGRELVDGGSTVDVFGGNVTDSSGSRLTAAGRAGFGMSKPAAGSATLALWYEITDSIGGVMVRDEWDRANYLVGGLVGPDANSKTGRNLIPRTGADVGSFAGVQSLMLARDSGNDRGKSSASSFEFDAIQAIAASHYAVQRRSALVTFPAAPSSVDKFSIELRGTNLHSGSTITCYRAEFVSTGGVLFTCNIVAYRNGVRTTFGIALLSGLSTGTDFTVDLDVQNIGGATTEDGTPNLVVRIDGVPVDGWLDQGVLGVTLMADGTVIDTRSGAIKTGWEQSYRFLRTGGSAAAFYVDDWSDDAVLPVAPHNDLAQISVSSETTGLANTLVLPISFHVEEVHNRPSARHEYESDHAQTLALGSRDRRRWRVKNDVAKLTERTSLITQFDTQHGVELPIHWTNPDGEAIVVACITPNLLTKLRDTTVDSFEFELEERFA